MWTNHISFLNGTFGSLCYVVLSVCRAVIIRFLLAEVWDILHNNWVQFILFPEVFEIQFTIRCDQQRQVLLLTSFGCFYPIQILLITCVPKFRSAIFSLAKRFMELLKTMIMSYSSCPKKYQAKCHKSKLNELIVVWLKIDVAKF